MLFRNIVPCFTAFVALAGAAATPLTHVVHEKRDVPSAHWQKRDRVARDALIPIRIGLKQNNLHLLYDRLMDVSHPDSPNYANHWTQDEVIEHFAPSTETVDAIRQWLNEFGIASHRILHTDNKGWLAMDLTGQEAEDLLKTEYYEHEHSYVDGKMAIGCDKYHVPAHIQKHIDYITPGVKHTGVRKRAIHQKRQYKRPATAALGFPGRGSPMQIEAPAHVPMLSKKGDLSNCSIVITPACVAALYNIPEPNGIAHPNNQMGVFEEGDYYSQKDLNLFFANFTPYIPQDTHPTLKSIDGGKSPVKVSQAGGESDLDMQLAYPIIYPQKLWVYQVDDVNYATGVLPNGGFGNTFLDALDGSYCNYTAFNETGDDPALDPIYPDTHSGGYNGSLQCGVHRPTNVISISYGEQENQLPAGYQERQCNEFGKLGLQGVSLFCASGDYGVAGPHRLSNTYGGCIGPNSTAFSPTNPNSCPYLTNVGATQIPTNGTVGSPESGAWGYFGKGTILFTSAGGFSNIYPIPDYQTSAIETYFTDYEPPFPYYEGGDNIGQNGGVYNRIGRGIPDVAANGLYIATFVEGEMVLEAGTSASSPIFAAIINRINEERLEIGKKTVGFINPALYSHPAMLNDIVNGTNPGCNTVGFEAKKGWDAVTGLGTPNYTKMLKYFINLP